MSLVRPDYSERCKTSGRPDGKRRGRYSMQRSNKLDHKHQDKDRTWLKTTLRSPFHRSNFPLM
jgi:hypothetical protein